MIVSDKWYDRQLIKMKWRILPMMLMALKQNDFYEFEAFSRPCQFRYLTFQMNLVVEHERFHNVIRR